MLTVTTIGLDIAKSVFQVHGVDAAGQVVVRRSVEAPLCFAVFSEGTVVPCWHRGLRFVTLLVARATGARPHRAADAAGLCEALHQETEE